MPFLILGVLFWTAVLTSEPTPRQETVEVNTSTSTAVINPTPIPTPNPSTTPTPEPKPNDSREKATVAKVVDGDTITLTDGRKLRYIGIDTPETVDPNRPVGCYGKEASDFTANLVLGKTIYLEKDVSETDKYGRLLRYVYLESGEMVNEILVRDGYASVSTYPPDVKYQGKFLTAEKQARDNKLGLWSSACEATPVPTPKPTATPTPVPTPKPTPKPVTVTPVTTPTPTVVNEPENIVNTPVIPSDNCPSNCTEAHAMGMSNMGTNHHCYAGKFDRDKDGIGCEK